MEGQMFGAEESGQPNKDLEVRDHFDRMTRAYLRSVLTDELIEEHRSGDASHPSEPLARLLAWCQRRPLPRQYAIKAEADSSFRLIAFAGKRGERPRYLGHERYATVREAQHGAFLRHISDLTE
jgi:branched-chain amino acid transport system permease protein